MGTDLAVNHKTGVYLEQAVEDVSHTLPTPAPFLSPPPPTAPQSHANSPCGPLVQSSSFKTGATLASHTVGLRVNLTEFSSSLPSGELTQLESKCI